MGGPGGSPGRRRADGGRGTFAVGVGTGERGAEPEGNRIAGRGGYGPACLGIDLFSRKSHLHIGLKVMIGEQVR